MNLKETADVLAKIQMFDNRTIDEVAVRAWQEVLADLGFSECLQAVAAHFRESSKWIMPADVRANVPQRSRLGPWDKEFHQ